MICGREIFGFRTLCSFPEILRGLDGPRVDTYLCMHTAAHTWKDDGGGVGEKENRKRENRNGGGGDWLILPLAAFSRHLIHLHTPSQPAFFSVRWFDVSFFLINSTFASIIQQKHPSEGMGMGECRGKGWGGFSGECGRQPPCSTFQAFVIPGNLFPVSILSP